MEDEIKDIAYYQRINDQEDKDYVLNRVKKTGNFTVTKRTAPSYIKAANALVTEGLLQRNGSTYTKKV